MAQQIQNRRDVSTIWTSANPILGQGEIGLETDTLRFKWGDGFTPWIGLQYAMNTVLSGTTAPGNTVGEDGDFYINYTPTVVFYGPKAGGVWPAGFTLAGAPSVWNGTTDPSESIGIDGDLYINTTTLQVYGPRVGGAWGVGRYMAGNAAVQTAKSYSMSLIFGG